MEAEQALADLLRTTLPPRFSSGKGFLIDTDGHQSRELDLIVLDSLNTARLFDFQAFDLIPIEAALACIEVKTKLTKSELDDTFEKFQAIQEMNFFEEKITHTWSDHGGTGVSVSTTSRPELILFAYDLQLSDNAIRDAYQRHPALNAAKICVIDKGSVVNLADPPFGLSWALPDEQEHHRRAGQVLAIFLFQYLLPALYAQKKGRQFYVRYLEGRSTFRSLQSA